MNKKLLLISLLSSTLLLSSCEDPINNETSNNKNINLSENNNYNSKNQNKIDNEETYEIFNPNENLADLKIDYNGESRIGSINIYDLNYNKNILTIYLDIQSSDNSLAEGLASTTISSITDNYLKKYPYIQIYQFDIKDVGLIRMNSDVVIDDGNGPYFPMIESGIEDELFEIYGLN